MSIGRKNEAQTFFQHYDASKMFQRSQTQQTFTCSKSTIEILKKRAIFKVNYKDNRTTSSLAS